MSEFDLEKRAVELGFSEDGHVVQLAREYADARAEEIAQELERVDWDEPGPPPEEFAPEVARSFISKPEPLSPLAAVDEAAIRADEREKAARLLDGRINDPQQGSHMEREACAKVLRHLARILREQPKPKTREQVLEEALLELAEGRFRALADEGDEYTVKAIARRALEAK